jgi:hypothetical protein
MVATCGSLIPQTLLLYHLWLINKRGRKLSQKKATAAEQELASSSSRSNGALLADDGLLSPPSTRFCTYTFIPLKNRDIQKFNSEHESICSCHRKKDFTMFKKFEQNFRSYVSTFYVHAWNFAKIRCLLWLVWKTKKSHVHNFFYTNICLFYRWH